MQGLNEKFKVCILTCTQAQKIQKVSKVQSLWSGYGQILRFRLAGGRYKSVIGKQVKLADGRCNPAGWNSDLSHQRKLKSYQVETHWYKNWRTLCTSNCKVPACLAIDTYENEVFIVLEDLNRIGYPARRNSVSASELEVCLQWLAWFHATYMFKQPQGLWQTGTYWHLDTRPDELQAMNDPPLQKAAPAIDKMLNNIQFKTFVHGDAKLQNFCFSNDGHKVAVVDFQYVGGGCGMKDVAYFISSCLDEPECERRERALLDYYFRHLQKALKTMSPNVDFDALHREWRALYPYAWVDFYRFLQGWAPGRWGDQSYSRKQKTHVLSELNR